MTTKPIKQQILDMYNNPTYQKLNAYYSKTTIFNVLGVERSENRHSSFLCWLLNNKSSHGLGDEPMKKFLRLYFSNNNVQTNDGALISHIMTGDYVIEIEEITTEKVIGKISKRPDKSRFDLWATFDIIYNHDDKQRKESYLLVIENKIYSSEGKKEQKEGKVFQTIKYYEAIQDIIGRTPIMVFLTPNGAEAQCDSFISLTYQQLMNGVIEPLVELDMPQESNHIITDYIRNLSKPSEGEGTNKHYSILATSKEECKTLSDFYNSDDIRQLYNSALVQVGGDSIRDLFEEKDLLEVKEQDSLLLTSLWDSNKELFKSILYNVIISHVNEKNKKKLLSIFVGKRDNTHYQINGKGDYKKGALVAEVIKIYINNHQDQVSIEDLQKAFPYTLRGKTNCLSHMIVLGNSKYNDIKESQRWRWLELKGLEKTITENGLQSNVYVTNQWGMSDEWKKLIKLLGEKAGVTIEEKN